MTKAYAQRKPNNTAIKTGNRSDCGAPTGSGPRVAEHAEPKWDAQMDDRSAPVRALLLDESATLGMRCMSSTHLGLPSAVVAPGALLGLRPAGDQRDTAGYLAPRSTYKQEVRGSSPRPPIDPAARGASAGRPRRVVAYDFVAAARGGRALVAVGRRWAGSAGCARLCTDHRRTAVTASNASTPANATDVANINPYINTDRVMALLSWTIRGVSYPRM